VDRCHVSLGDAVELGTTLSCSDVESDDFVADKVIARRCSFRDLDRHFTHGGKPPSRGTKILSGVSIGGVYLSEAKENKEDWHMEVDSPLF